MNLPIEPTQIGRLRREIQPQITIPQDEPERPIIDFLSSDETLDRHDEVLSASGWRLQNYLKNPIVQNAHQYGSILHTIGKALVTRVTEHGLYQRVEFATEINPIAKIAYQLYRGKFLNGVSVGFIPIRWEAGEPKSKIKRRYVEQELLEVSAVSIPSNPNALQAGYKEGAIDKSDLREFARALKDALAWRDEPAAFYSWQERQFRSQSRELLSLAEDVLRR